MTEAGTVAAEGAVVAVTAAAAVNGVSQREVGTSLRDSTSEDEDGWQLGGISGSEGDDVPDGAQCSTSGDVVAGGAQCSTPDDHGWRPGDRERVGVPSGESGSGGAATSHDGVIVSVVRVGKVAVTTLSAAKGVGLEGVDGIRGPRS